MKLKDMLYKIQWWSEMALFREFPQFKQNFHLFTVTMFWKMHHSLALYKLSPILPYSSYHGFINFINLYSKSCMFLKSIQLNIIHLLLALTSTIMKRSFHRSIWCPNTEDMISTSRLHLTAAMEFYLLSLFIYSPKCDLTKNWFLLLSSYIL